jgi:hypothetical protein
MNWKIELAALPVIDVDRATPASPAAVCLLSLPAGEAPGPVPEQPGPGAISLATG